MPAVTSTSSIGQDQLRIDGQTLTVNGIDPATVTGAYRYEWAARSSEQSRRDLGANGAIVDQSFATSHHLTVGSEIDARLAAGGSPHLVVRGIDVPPKWGALGLGPITISTATFRSAFPLGRDRLTFVNVAQPDPRTLAPRWRVIRESRS